MVSSFILSYNEHSLLFPESRKRICWFADWTRPALLDYPGHVAATVFLGGCNFRCPFCHNSSLVLHRKREQLYSPEEILRFLEKRRSVLTGVTITGGDRPARISRISYGISMLSAIWSKLDTNGSMASSLQELLESKVLDYIAMDIKSDLAHYGDAIGISNPAQLASIRKISLPPFPLLCVLFHSFMNFALLS